MRDYLDIDPSPLNENGVQVSRDTNYMPAMKAETLRFVSMLEKRFKNLIEKTGIYFRVAKNQHDFGTYLSVRICFDDENEAQTDATYFIESHCPETWDDDTVFEWPVRKILKKEN